MDVAAWLSSGQWAKAKFYFRIVAFEDEEWCIPLLVTARAPAATLPYESWWGAELEKAWVFVRPHINPHGFLQTLCEWRWHLFFPAPTTFVCYIMQYDTEASGLDMGPPRTFLGKIHPCSYDPPPPPPSGSEVSFLLVLTAWTQDPMLFLCWAQESSAGFSKVLYAACYLPWDLSRKQGSSL